MLFFVFFCFFFFVFFFYLFFWRWYTNALGSPYAERIVIYGWKCSRIKGRFESRLTLSLPNFRRHLLSVFCGFFEINYCLERGLYVKLKDWTSNSVDYKLSHLDLCCLQKPIIIAYGRERVKLQSLLSCLLKRFFTDGCFQELLMITVLQKKGILDWSDIYQKSLYFVECKRMNNEMKDKYFEFFRLTPKPLFSEITRY